MPGLKITCKTETFMGTARGITLLEKIYEEKYGSVSFHEYFHYD